MHFLKRYLAIYTHALIIESKNTKTTEYDKE